MAHVFLALSRSHGGARKLVVLKELLPNLKDEPEVRAMFLDEGRVAVKLSHPNVVQTYEVYTDGEQPVIVMEYLDGQSLAALVNRLTRENMPLDVHLHVLAEVLRGLHYAHELRDLDGTWLGLIHRDVSPHNVIVTYDGHVKLVDFGIAKTVGSESHTRTGVFKGKVSYAAPEQIEKRPLDRRSDLFSVGVMLWEALARRRIITGEIDLSALTRRIGGQDPRILEVAPGTPEDLAAVCDKAMARDREDRFATAEEFRAALLACLPASREVDDAQVGELVSREFAAERAKLREVVEARVKELAARVSLPSLPTAQVPPAIDNGPAGNTRERMALTSDPGEPPREPPTAHEATRSRVRSIVLGVGLAAAGAGLLAKVLTQPGPGATPAASSAPSASDTVAVAFAADPPAARLFLDNVELSTNPFRGALPRGPRARVLRAEAPGFVTEERFVVLDRDLDLRAQLRPAPPEPTASAAASAAAPSVRWAPRAPSEVEPPPAAKPPPPPSPTPGEGIQGGKRKPPRPIDDRY
jgi:serine/threonine-protein kinase